MPKAFAKSHQKKIVKIALSARQLLSYLIHSAVSGQ